MDKPATWPPATISPLLHTKEGLAYRLLPGPANRPWLIFLHEGLGSMAQWGDFPVQLCQICDCPGLLYDRQGHGQSLPLTTGRDIHYLHLAALLEWPGVRQILPADCRYFLIGHSDGGSIALIAAATPAARLCGLITEAAHVLVEECTLVGIRQARQAWAAGRLEGLRHYHGWQTEALFSAWADTWLSPDFAFWNIEYLLPAVHRPLLAIQGDGDLYGSPRQLTIIGEKCPQATTLLLPDCGHVPHKEQRKATLSAISQFIGRHSKTPLTG